MVVLNCILLFACIYIYLQFHAYFRECVCLVDPGTLSYIMYANPLWVPLWVMYGKVRYGYTDCVTYVYKHNHAIAYAMLLYPYILMSVCLLILMCYVFQRSVGPFQDGSLPVVWPPCAGWDQDVLPSVNRIGPPLWAPSPAKGCHLLLGRRREVPPGAWMVCFMCSTPACMCSEAVPGLCMHAIVDRYLGEKCNSLTVIPDAEAGTSPNSPDLQLRMRPPLSCIYDIHHYIISDPHHTGTVIQFNWVSVSFQLYTTILSNVPTVYLDAKLMYCIILSGIVHTDNVAQVHYALLLSTILSDYRSMLYDPAQLTKISMSTCPYGRILLAVILLFLLTCTNFGCSILCTSGFVWYGPRLTYSLQDNAFILHIEPAVNHMVADILPHTEQYDSQTPCDAISNAVFAHACRLVCRGNRVLVVNICKMIGRDESRRSSDLPMCPVYQLSFDPLKGHFVLGNDHPNEPKHAST